MSDYLAERAADARARLEQQIADAEARLHDSAVRSADEYLKRGRGKHIEGCEHLAAQMHEIELLRAVLGAIDEALERQREEAAERQRQKEADAPRLAAEEAAKEQRRQWDANAHAIAMALHAVRSTIQQHKRPRDEDVALIRAYPDVDSARMYGWERLRELTLHELRVRPWWPAEIETEGEIDHA